MTLATEPVLSDTSQAQGHLRQLGSFEELLWQMDKRSPVHATLVAHVEGRTTVAEWTDALEQTRRRHPLWSARIAKASGDRPYFRNSPDLKVAFRVLEGDFSRNWQQEVSRELSLPMHPESGPLVRAVLLHTNATCMLILSAHHSICDGMSLAFSIRDVLQALSGAKLTNLGLHASQEDALGLCSQPRAQMREIEQAPEHSGSPSVFRSASSIVPEVRSLRFSFPVTEALRKRAREEKTTVHAALIAASGMATRQNLNYASGRALHICSTINNRKLIGSPEDCALFFTASDFSMADTPMISFWNLARSAKGVLNLGQSSTGVKAVLGAVAGIVQSGLDAYSAGEQGGKLFRFDLHVSNLGVVPIPTSYGSLALQEFWGPAVLLGFDGEQNLGISTLNGRLNLLHTSHRPLPYLLEQIESSIRQACSS